MCTYKLFCIILQLSVVLIGLLLFLSGSAWEKAFVMYGLIRKFSNREGYPCPDIPKTLAVQAVCGEKK